MKKLLHIISSPRKTASESGKIADAFINQYRLSNPDAEIDELNLWTENIPIFDGDKAAAKMTFFGSGKLEGKIKSSWDEVVRVTNRFTSADEYLITVPMWNGGIPWTLKHYIDTITQPGLAFGFGADGYFPLLKDKKACVIYTSGVYSPSLPAAFGEDYQSNYMNWWLGFIGITDVYSIEFFSNALDQNLSAAQAAVAEKAKRVARTRFEKPELQNG